MDSTTCFIRIIRKARIGIKFIGDIGLAMIWCIGEIFLSHCLRRRTLLTRMGIGPEALPMTRTGCRFCFLQPETTAQQRVGLARSTFTQDGDNDLVHWVKHPSPVVVQHQGIGNFGDFRDPFVWKDGDIWYMLVGSGTDGEGGTALAYTSKNLTDWEYKGPFYISDHNHYPYLGPVWELPVLLPLGKDKEGRDKHVFLISPVGAGADVEVFYWIGTFDKEHVRFIPDQNEPQLIDVGDFHFTGPSGMVDPKTGRKILFTIAQGERTPALDYSARRVSDVKNIRRFKPAEIAGFCFNRLSSCRERTTRT
jgi:hypothetical protein